MQEITPALPHPSIWPVLKRQGYEERCQAILEAIVWITDSEDLPTAIELVYLAIDENWQAAHEDVFAIASAWALRDLVYKKSTEGKADASRE
jgi:hypothetical protein